MDLLSQRKNVHPASPAGVVESYGEHGKVRHRTLSTLGHGSDEEIQAIKLAIKHKADLQQLGTVRDEVEVRPGLAVGAV